MSPAHHVIETARSADLAAAFALLYARLDPRNVNVRVAHALRLIAEGGLDPAGAFVAREGDDVVGAIVGATVPGAGALIWPPVAQGPEMEDALIAAACHWLRRQGARVMQCLLDEDREALGRPLLRCGFDRVTWLTYLDHDLLLPLEVLTTPSRLDFVPFADCPDQFAKVLQQTYEDTLDCPELNGARNVAEVLEGHRAQGRSGDRLWRLVHWRGEPVGVLILADQGDEWELAYMGVVPAARRQGVGREMLLHALTEARAAPTGGLTLCVDERNERAWRLYRWSGMVPRGRRAVYLAVGGRAGERADRTGAVAPG